CQLSVLSWGRVSARYGWATESLSMRASAALNARLVKVDAAPPVRFGARSLTSYRTAMLSGRLLAEGWAAGADATGDSAPRGAGAHAASATVRRRMRGWRVILHMPDSPCHARFSLSWDVERRARLRNSTASVRPLQSGA